MKRVYMLKDITGDYANELYIGKYSYESDGYGLFAIESIDVEENDYVFLTDTEFQEALKQFGIFREHHFEVYEGDLFD